MEAIAPGLRP